jgi:hypothetical protein
MKEPLKIMTHFQFLNVLIKRKWTIDLCYLACFFLILMQRVMQRVRQRVRQLVRQLVMQLSPSLCFLLGNHS